MGKVEEILKRVCNEMESNDFVLVIGDFNASGGKRSINRNKSF